MDNMQNSLDNNQSSDIILFVLKRWKPIFIISFIAFVASIYISLNITPKYKSSIILFPKTSDPVSKMIKADNLISEKEFLNFGEEEEVEQMLQVLHSDEIRHKIIENYNLAKHYGIDLSSKYPQTSLYNEFIGNISFKKTEYMSVNITVLDTDPIMAANIANDIAELHDSLMNKMKKEIAFRAFKIVKKEYKSLQNDIKELQDSLKTLTNPNNKEFLKGFIKNEINRLSHLKSKYAEAKVDAEYSLPYKFVLNPAYPAEKKSYPVRWLIVVVSSLSTFVLTIILLAFFNRYKTAFKN